MKSLKKIAILISAIGLLSSYVINTQAASIQGNHPLIQQQNNLVIAFTLPLISSGSSVNNNLISTMTKHSLHSENTKQMTTTDTCQSKKGNEVYEFTALFNDKLQLLLSYFSTPKSKNSIEDKPEDKESIQVVSMMSR